jgi:hypothetical protein
MTTVAIILHVLFILCLTSSVVTRAVGLVKADDKPIQKIWIPAIFGLSQGVLALLGYGIGSLIDHLITYIAEYVVFAMMFVVAIKLFVDAIGAMKGKILYTINKEIDIILLSILAAINTFLYSLVSVFFAPLGITWFFVAVTLAGFLWAFIIMRKEFSPGMIKKVSFIEFSAAVFMVILAILYLFTDMMK